MAHTRFIQALVTHPTGRTDVDPQYRADMEDITQNPITRDDFPLVYALTRDPLLTVPDMNDHGRFEQRYERFARALTEHEQDKYVHPIELKVVKDFVKDVVPIALYNDVQNNPIEPRDFDEIYHIQQSGSVLIPVYQDMGFFERRYSRFVQSMNAPSTQFLHPSERKAVTEYLTFVQQNTITSKDFAWIDALIHTDTKSVNRGDGWFIVALNAYMNGTYMHPSQTTVVNAYVKYARARDKKRQASTMPYN